MRQNFHAEYHIVSKAAAARGVSAAQLQRPQEHASIRATKREMHDRATALLADQGAGSWVRITSDGRSWRTYSIRANGELQMSGTDLQNRPNGSWVLHNGSWQEDIGWGPGVEPPFDTPRARAIHPGLI
jgi:hypothetical protein